jgi:diacylglycerol kinase family enzyme
MLFFSFFPNASSTIQVGLSQATRLAQGKAIKIHASSAFPVQIDGEPFIHQPGCLEITHDEQVLYSLSLIVRT